jgi:opacity protein-like surface antigen
VKKTALLMAGVWCSTAWTQTPHGDAFERVQRIFDARCISCHSSLEAPGNLSLERGRSYRHLVNVPSDGEPSMRRVAPNDVVNSYLYRKIVQDPEKFPFKGDPMPLGEEPLSVDEINTIAAWIHSFPQDVWGGERQAVTAMDKADEPVETFLATQLINLPTTRVLGNKTAEFRILHRFGLINGSGGNTFGSFFGLDNGANTSLNLSIALRDNVDLLIRRTGVNKDFEIGVKYVPLPQRSYRPWSVGFFASLDWISRDDVQAANRLSPNFQILASAKVHPRLSLLVVPTFAFRSNHNDPIIRNGSIYKDTRYTMALGLGTQYEFMPNTALTAEYIPRLDGYKGIAGADDRRFNTWSVGLAYKIRLHVFQVLLSNSQVLHTTQYVAGSSATASSKLWDGGANFHFGFNIIRQFKW